MIALFTTVDNVIVGVAASHLSAFGAVQVLLSQARIPISMAISRALVPGTAYSASEYVGAAVVILGILATLLPDAVAQGGDAEFAAALPWMLVYVTHCVPNALIFVYQERVLKEAGAIDDVYFNAKTQLPTLVVTLALLVPGAILDGTPADGIGDDLARGAACEFGVTPPGDAQSCALAPLATHAFIAVNTLWNVMSVTVLAGAGANVAFLISTFTLPLAACVFALPFMPRRKDVTAWTFLGMVLITAGLLVYRFGGELRAAAVCRFPEAAARAGRAGEWLLALGAPRRYDQWTPGAAAYQAVGEGGGE